MLKLPDTLLRCNKSYLPGKRSDCVEDVLNMRKTGDEFRKGKITRNVSDREIVYTWAEKQKQVESEVRRLSRMIETQKYSEFTYM